MSEDRQLRNHVKARRESRGWSQEELAQRAGISRASVSAIEIHRLTPSVAAALALAKALGCGVEDLFGVGDDADAERWAWQNPSDPCRFWRARVGNRILRYPAEPTVAGMLPHDGILELAESRIVRDGNPERTLVMASCDPAAGLLAAEYERVAGLRLLPLHRSSRDALNLLREGVVHVAGVHLASSDSASGNARAAKAVLGAGFSQLRFATWDEGLALGPSKSSVGAILRANLRWVGRQAGAGARQCQDEILGNRPEPRRIARDHGGVAEAIRGGWADVGVCLRLVSEQAGLRFIHVRHEAYDLFFPTAFESDRRLTKLVEILRSASGRSLFESLPGYELSRTIETFAI